MKDASCEEEAAEQHKPGAVDFIEAKMAITKGYWPCCRTFTNITRMVECSQQEEFNDEISVHQKTASFS